AFVLASAVPGQAESVSAFGRGTARPTVFGPRSAPHPRVAELVAERNAAAAAGDIELALDIECRIQAVYQELHPLESANHQYQVWPGREALPAGDDPDVVIDTFRFLATAADYELGGPMWATAFSQQDTIAWIYVSEDHGETWRKDVGYSTSPRQRLTPLGCVVGEGDSLFVYCFFIDPRGAGGDLTLSRWDPRTRRMVFRSVLAGPDTVTDFAVCRDYKGFDYWLYAVAANELGPANAINDHILRSTDYGLTWAVLGTLRYVQNPHMSAGVANWMFMSIEIGPEFPGNYNVLANSWFWSPDTLSWETSFFPDTFEVHDVVVAPAFTEPADSATLWVLYAYNRENTGDWNIKYRWTPVFFPDWSDTLVLAGHPDFAEWFPDIRNYNFAGNAWMNACYITEGPQFRAVQRRHAHAANPTQWSDPININETSAGTGSDVKPKLCYSPGAGPGAGVVFTGEGLMSLYWNAPWRTGVAEERTKYQGQRTSQTICRGTLTVGAGHDRNQLGDFGSCPKSVLLDISGRKVMDLVFGENDVSQVAPGVYFCRSTVRSQAGVGKVVIQR
ncbi:MAG: hypothetical protein JSU73_01315, partial [candidate division WOR-3 bacterium]